MWLDEIKRCFSCMEQISVHEQLLELYRIYLCIGGMPKAVENFVKMNQEILLWDNSILKHITISYLADMSKYTFNHSESIKIEKVYKAIPSSLAKEKVKKFKYADIEKDAKRDTFESAIDWLISSNMVHKCMLVNLPQMPLKAFEQENTFKLYLNDVALLTMALGLNYSDIVLNKAFLYKGTIAENYVAQIFSSNGIGLYYWKSGNEAELDFLLDTEDGIIPVEVKVNDNIRSQSLELYAKRYAPAYSIRISAKNFGFTNNIKSIPLYAAFCIKAKKQIF